ncbi:hypothetical protein GSI_05541 [Ganoderma sinense ZZ0214-1]|uniref:Uncharacterized protein n=1 Tax=Ganoderma sinense ZZ0214-1 TaxID=1077348 RepID=A0A2G8SEV0_9APHY|nr:hypothetical protein GSI_05541 [Ganoderma sinense ZZ0214-1]
MESEDFVIDGIAAPHTHHTARASFVRNKHSPLTLNLFLLRRGLSGCKYISATGLFRLLDIAIFSSAPGLSNSAPFRRYRLQPCSCPCLFLWLKGRAWSKHRLRVHQLGVKIRRSKLSANPNVTTNATVVAHPIPTILFGLSILGYTSAIYLNLDAHAELDLSLTGAADGSMSTGLGGGNTTTTGTALGGGCVDISMGLAVDVGADVDRLVIFKVGENVMLFGRTWDPYKTCFGDDNLNEKRDYRSLRRAPESGGLGGLRAVRREPFSRTQDNCAESSDGFACSTVLLGNLVSLVSEIVNGASHDCYASTQHPYAPSRVRVLCATLSNTLPAPLAQAVATHSYLPIGVRAEHTVLVRYLTAVFHISSRYSIALFRVSSSGLTHSHRSFARARALVHSPVFSRRLSPPPSLTYLRPRTPYFLIIIPIQPTGFYPTVYPSQRAYPLPLPSLSPIIRPFAHARTSSRHVSLATPALPSQRGQRHMRRQLRVERI